MQRNKNLKKRQFLWDVIVNTGAFGIYMIAFHVLLLPYLANVLPVDTNAKFLLYVMIANIATLSFGNELGVLYQVKMGRVSEENVFNDVLHLLNYSNILMILISPVFILLKFTWLDVLFIIFITVITNIRLFLQSILRHKKRFLAIFISNIGYLLGTIIGIVLYKYVSNNFWWCVLIPEFVGLVLIFLLEKSFFTKLKPVSKNFRQIKKNGLDIVVATLLGNVPNYGDKILALPLLGSLSMSVYYAGTALSKMLLLIINPINGVLLSWLSNNEVNDRESVIKRILRINIILIIVVFLLSFPIIYITTYFLYNNFLGQVVTIILPLAISSAFNISTANLKIVFLRYYKIETVKYINIAKIALFIILTPLGAKLGGLLGFAYSVAFSNAILWFVYYISMRFSKESY